MVTRRSLLTAAGIGGLGLTSGCLDLAREGETEYRASLAVVNSDTVEQEGFEHLSNEELDVEKTVNPPVGDERTVRVYNWVAKYGRPVTVTDIDMEALEENVTEEVAEETNVDEDTIANQSIDLETLEKNGISEEMLLQSGLDREELEDGSVDLETLRENDIDLETLQKYGIETDDLTGENQDGDGSNGDDGSGADDSDGGAGIVASTDRNGVLLGLVSTPKAEIAGRNFNPVADMDHEELLERFGDRISDQGIGDITLVEESTETLFGDSVPLSVFETTKTIQNREVDFRIYVLTATHEGDIVVAVGLHPKLADVEDSVRTMIRNVEHPTEQSESGSGSGSDSDSGSDSGSDSDSGSGSDSDSGSGSDSDSGS